MPQGSAQPLPSNSLRLCPPGMSQEPGSKKATGYLSLSTPTPVHFSLSLPTDNTERKQPTASQEEDPNKNLAVLTAEPGNPFLL